SEMPIAIACFRLVTRFPLLPLRSVPRLRSRITRAIFRTAFSPYLAMTLLPDGRWPDDPMTDVYGVPSGPDDGFAGTCGPLTGVRAGGSLAGNDSSDASSI